MKVKQLLKILAKLPPNAPIGIGTVGHDPVYVSTVGTVSVHEKTGIVSVNCSKYGGQEHDDELEGKFKVVYEHPEFGKE